MTLKFEIKKGIISILSGVFIASCLWAPFYIGKCLEKRTAERKEISVQYWKNQSEKWKQKYFRDSELQRENSSFIIEEYEKLTDKLIEDLKESSENMQEAHERGYKSGITKGRFKERSEKILKTLDNKF
jgi:FMN phosphatase YigB (HAD superfamily)